MEGDPSAMRASKCVKDFYPRPHMEGDGDTIKVVIENA